MIALGASLTRTPYGQHLQGPRKNKFKIHNSVNADDINKDETAGEHTTACTEVSRDLCKSRDESLEIFARVETMLLAACSHRRRCGVQTSPSSATPR